MIGCSRVLLYIFLLSIISKATGAIVRQNYLKQLIIEFSKKCNSACHEVVFQTAEKYECQRCHSCELGSAATTSKSWMAISCTQKGLTNGAAIKKELMSKGIAVLYVEEDLVGVIQYKRAPWNVYEVAGESGIKQRCPYSYLGETIIIAVMDSGCTARGTGFDAIKCKNYIRGEPSNLCADRNGKGHGFAVAAVAAGSKYGVAPYADLACLRVLGNDGKGRYSYFIRALNDVAKFAKDSKRKIVLNISLAGRRSQELNDAVAAAAAAGVYIVIAAGNYAKDVANYSPASSADNRMIFAVGGHDKSGRRISISNYGKQVQLSAPGQRIVTPSIKGGRIASTGTSLAAPHVAGAIAILLSDDQEVSLKNLEARATVKYPTGLNVHKTKYNCKYKF